MSSRASAITVPGIVLSQPEIATSASKLCALGDELDRIRDQLPRDQRRAHPRGAHRDAVRDRDRVELHRRAPRRADALLDLRREHPVVEVARHRLDPRVRDADDRLREILGGVADPVQVRARRGPLRPVGQRAAAVLDVEGTHAARTLPAAPPPCATPPPACGTRRPGAPPVRAHVARRAPLHPREALACRRARPPRSQRTRRARSSRTCSGSS